MKDYKEKVADLIMKYEVYRDCSKTMKEKHENSKANVPLAKLYESEETIYSTFIKELEMIVGDRQYLYKKLAEMQ